MYMTIHSYVRTTLWLTLAGVLFAGYLSAMKLITNTCALNEPCPYVWGHPACWYGFGMFLIMFVATLVAFVRADDRRWVVWVNVGVSLLGIAFAGTLVWRELAHAASISSAFGYTLGLPSCAYGLIVYAAIFILSVLMLMRGHRSHG